MAQAIAKQGSKKKGARKNMVVEVFEPVVTVAPEAEHQTFASSDVALDLVTVPSSDEPISTISHVKAGPLGRASQEPTVLAEPSSLVATSPLPLPTSIIASDVKTLIVASLLSPSFQIIKECSLIDLVVRVVAVRDCATTLRAISYDKELFYQFERLLSKLKRWGIEASQRELEVQRLCGPRLTALEEALAQHQGLIRDYEEKKTIYLSNQPHLKKEDVMYSIEIIALDEERDRLDTNIHKMKTQQE
ncbi:hypothetical protein AMTR_s00150p00052380 [Amborella trichopoda]|uniref:Uncharacterized protein n=1 Tax=Amborella trichopoda TaxID=13333 RepID=W1PMQ1_AMBTC|nr:hypothetical protein AMTR_s00150p00052380 [Amborella trichopoda]